jgi:hypothetical protein
MDRRTALAALGTGLAGLSGCAGLLGGSTSTLTPVEVESPTPPPRTAGTPSLPGGVPACAEFGDGYRTTGLPVELPTTPARFDTLGCPAPAWADEVVCAHRVDTETAPTVLTGEGRASVSQADGDVLAFALVNRPERFLRLRPGGWSVLAWTGDRRGPGRWRTVAAGEPGCLRTLGGVGVHWWRLGVQTSVAATSTDVTGASAALGAGTYLFVVPVTADEGAIALAAPFDVVGAGPAAGSGAAASGGHDE